MTEFPWVPVILSLGAIAALVSLINALPNTEEIRTAKCAAAKVSVRSFEICAEMECVISRDEVHQYIRDVEYLERCNGN